MGAYLPPTPFVPYGGQTSIKNSRTKDAKNKSSTCNGLAIHSRIRVVIRKVCGVLHDYFVT
jgi:hypothetical protein